MRITMFSILSAGAGVLTLASCGGGPPPLPPPVPIIITRPTRSSVDPSGQFFYVVQSGGSNIYQFKINAGGTLSALSPASVTAPSNTVDIRTTQRGGTGYA